jgi:hypothetical protein
MNNPYVIEKVMNTLAQLDIKVYESFQMLDWDSIKTPTGEYIKSVTFKKSNPEHQTSASLEIPCNVSACIRLRNSI